MELYTQKGCLKLNIGEYWERQMAFIIVLWEQPPIVHIEEKEQVIDRHKVIEEQHRSRGGSLLVYTDGSAHRGHVGAVAATGGRDKYRQLYMGLEMQLIVYAVELQGVRIGLSLAVYNTRVRELFIFTDNQAAIQVIHRPQQPSGQEIIGEIWHSLQILRSQGTIVSIYWIPGHKGILGNEEADK
jgi:ribonuclease HI